MCFEGLEIGRGTLDTLIAQPAVVIQVPYFDLAEIAVYPSVSSQSEPAGDADFLAYLLQNQVTDLVRLSGLPCVASDEYCPQDCVHALDHGLLAHCAEPRSRVNDQLTTLNQLAGEFISDPTNYYNKEKCDTYMMLMVELFASMAKGFPGGVITPREDLWDAEKVATTPLQRVYNRMMLSSCRNGRWFANEHCIFCRELPDDQDVTESICALSFSQSTCLIDGRPLLYTTYDLDAATELISILAVMYQRNIVPSQVNVRSVYLSPKSVPLLRSIFCSLGIQQWRILTADFCSSMDQNRKPPSARIDFARILETAGYTIW